MFVTLITIQNFLWEKSFTKFPVVLDRHVWNYEENKNVFLLMQSSD